jgi:hypothetical protein
MDRHGTYPIRILDRYNGIVIAIISGSYSKAANQVNGIGKAANYIHKNEDETKQ